MWPAAAITVLASAAIASGLDLPQPGVWMGVAMLAGLVASAMNSNVPGTAIVMLGLGANLLALAVNGHIAVDPDALVAAEIVTADQIATVELGTGRQLQTPQTQLPVLGAVIPVRALSEVVSFGDLLLIAGLGNVGFRLLRPAKARITSIQRHQPMPDRRVIDLTQHDLRAVPTIPAAGHASATMVTIAGEAEHLPEQRE